MNYINEFLLVFAAYLDIFKSLFIPIIYLLIMIDNLNTILNPKKFAWWMILFQVIVMYSIETNIVSANEVISNNSWVFRIVLGTVPLFAFSILASELQGNIKNKLKNIKLKTQSQNGK